MIAALDTWSRRRSMIQRLDEWRRRVETDERADAPELRLANALRALAAATAVWGIRPLDKDEVINPLNEAARALEDMAASRGRARG